MTDKLEVHVSGVQGHQECPRRWWLLSWLGWRPIPVAPALFLGSLVHETMDVHYRKGEGLELSFVRLAAKAQTDLAAESPGGVLWTGEQEVLAEQFMLGVGMIKGYAKWQEASKSGMADSNIKVLDVEGTFSFEHEGLWWGGRWDGIFQHRPSGKYYLFEHKTCRSISEVKKGVRWDPQPILYYWAANEVFDFPIEGVVYNLLQKNDPWKVRILQNGLPSKDKSQPTNAEVYADVLDECIQRVAPKREQQILKEYSEHLTYLRYEAPQLYDRFLWKIHPRRIAPTLRVFREEAMKMKDTVARGPDCPAYWNRFRCGWCPVNEVCEAMDRGDDWERKLELNFVKPKGKHRERVEEGSPAPVGV